MKRRGFLTGLLSLPALRFIPPAALASGGLVTVIPSGLGGTSIPEFSVGGDTVHMSNAANRIHGQEMLSYWDLKTGEFRIGS